MGYGPYIREETDLYLMNAPELQPRRWVEEGGMVGYCSATGSGSGATLACAEEECVDGIGHAAAKKK